MPSLSTAVQATTSVPTLYMALELAKEKCLAVSGTGRAGDPIRQVTVPLCSKDVLEEVTRARARFRLPGDAPVVTVYEAGFSGFWLYRELTKAPAEYGRSPSPSTTRIDPSPRSETRSGERASQGQSVIRFRARTTGEGTGTGRVRPEPVPVDNANRPLAEERDAKRRASETGAVGDPLPCSDHGGGDRHRPSTAGARPRRQRESTPSRGARREAASERAKRDAKRRATPTSPHPPP